MTLSAQKKPLDHTVYDGWQSVGEKKLSRDGKWILYTIDPQEGDGELVIQSADLSFKKSYPRGYLGNFSADSRHAIFRIKPLYTETRQARIKKKKPEEFPKDSLCIVSLASGQEYRASRVKSYSLPDKNGEWIAWHLEKPLPDTSKQFQGMDTAMKRIDSVKKVFPKVTEEKPDRKRKQKPGMQQKEDDELLLPSADTDAEGDDAAGKAAEEGTELVVRNLASRADYYLPRVTEYRWSDNGKILLFETIPDPGDRTRGNSMVIWRSVENNFDTVCRKGNEFGNLAVDERGYQVAFTAEKDSSRKALQKFHKLWYWQNGMSDAQPAVEQGTPGMMVGWSVSEHGPLRFSKSGDRLFFGTAPVRPARDTSLVEIDLVKIDIWHYNDDYLQSQQLKNLDRELKRTYTAVYYPRDRRMVQLADQAMPQVLLPEDGDGHLFAGITDLGKRVEAQWEGTTKRDIYQLDPLTGGRKLVKKDLTGTVQLSPKGNYIVWYDAKERQYFASSGRETKMISSGIPYALYDEQYDMPSYPTAYGIARWTAGDSNVLVYDRYDIWKLDPTTGNKPVNLTQGIGRKHKVIYRYLNTDPREPNLKAGQYILLRTVRDSTKRGGLARYKLGTTIVPHQLMEGEYSLNNLIRAEEADVYAYTRESFRMSPDLYLNQDWSAEKKLTAINPQQDRYSWGTVELFRWKAYDGKMTTGMVYKPEGFDPKEKYPVIAYFYEKLSDGLHNYLPPSPTPSRLNIPFFVSRGYVVFAPDISYRNGYPGKSAYDYVVSGARALARKGWADSTRMGLQGQSWGGYQIAYIITRTTLFKAAWAGAPVANMTSAYGGIRWETGLNRQFQYERSQSRIGATLWEKPQLYIENSPLFSLPRVKTPLVIMANDNDGAVPWYQGIELFTAMRRLGKQVWLLNYNGEAHNLVERKNRKDIQIREQQFFDWLLKGEKPARWLSEGVPAIEKGRDWGLEIR